MSRNNLPPNPSLEPDLSATPTSKGVQDRILRSRSVIIAGFVYADIFVEAWTRRLNDFLFRPSSNGEWKRLGQWLAATRPEGDRAPSDPGHMFRCIALDAEELGEAMVRADVIRTRCKAEHRRALNHRNRHARRTYRELSQTRKLLKVCLGYREACDTLGLQGPTPRDPSLLLDWARAAIQVLGDPELAPACDFANGGRLKTSELAERLKTCCASLRQAIEAVTQAYWAEVAAVEARRLAITTFDRDVQRGARVLETVLDYFGLPSLAATVRPGDKRRGRPPRNAPVDAYPDLVERVLGETGFDEDGSTAETGDLEATTGFRKIEQALRKPSDGNRKTEQASHERPNHALKIERDARKWILADRKIKNPHHKLPAKASNRLSARFTSPKRRHRSQRRIVHGLDSRLQGLAFGNTRTPGLKPRAARPPSRYRGQQIEVVSQAPRDGG